MATLGTSIAVLLCNTLCNAIDVGTVGALKFRGASATVIATLNFTSDSFGSAVYNASDVGARATMSATEISDTSADYTLTVTDAIIEASGGTDIFGDLICTTTGGDITMTSKSISAGDTVTLTTLKIVMPLS